MRAPAVLALAFLALVWVAPSADAQVGTLVSPGPLSRAHATVEGLSNCQKCHTPGQAVTASKCLSCHKPIADRIARRVGVHRDVTDECASCHAEHGGSDVDLRRIDRQRFDHAAETGFPLDGQHAGLSQRCADCHKVRSFLAARPSCDSCHADVHKGQLGSQCTRCHSTLDPFKGARLEFDHARTRFLLTGAHRTVDCAKCHVKGQYRDLRFDTCDGCHRVPHRSQLGPSCTTCHVTDRWATHTIDHAKTGFALVGQHQQVACAQCHTAGFARPLRFDRCSACHDNVHRDSLKEDCATCHTQATFRGAAFDHAKRTPFALAGKHVGLACRKCHTSLSPEGTPMSAKVLDFGGASPDCVTCHTDEHKGQFGRDCEACHRPATFKAKGFVHPRVPEFYAGKHLGLACERCHVQPATQASRVGLRVALARGRAPSMNCDTCHGDVHLGQVGLECERCHVVAADRFAPVRFSHANAGFTLNGKHSAVECAKCHTVQNRAFPGGVGSARLLKPLSGACEACHKDPHLGQVLDPCTTCHSTQSFSLLGYRHRGLEALFSVGSHGRLPCRSCHKTETAQFPSGRGTTVRLKGLGTTCLACHP